MKTSGVLAKGRDMTEKQRLIWLMSMAVCAEVNCTMQELTNVIYNSEQNNELTKKCQITVTQLPLTLSYKL